MGQRPLGSCRSEWELPPPGQAGRGPRAPQDQLCLVPEPRPHQSLQLRDVLGGAPVRQMRTMHETGNKPLGDNPVYTAALAFGLIHNEQNCLSCASYGDRRVVPHGSSGSRPSLTPTGDRRGRPQPLSRSRTPRLDTWGRPARLPDLLLSTKAAFLWNSWVTGPGKTGLSRPLKKAPISGFQ